MRGDGERGLGGGGGLREGRGGRERLGYFIDLSVLFS